MIDAYVDRQTLDLLSAKQAGVLALILTKSVDAATVASARAFQIQHRDLSIRTSSAFHDRFLFVDDVEFYHLGQSVKDAGRRIALCSQLEEGSVIRVLTTQFDSEWERAQVVV